MPEATHLPAHDDDGDGDGDGDQDNSFDLDDGDRHVSCDTTYLRDR